MHRVVHTAWRSVIESATTTQLKAWVRKLPSVHKDNFVDSIFERAKGVEQYEVLEG